MIGHAMVRAYQYVLENPGCSKTQVTDHAHLNGEPRVDFQSLNRAIHIGLIIPDLRLDGRFSLRAHTFETMPVEAARQLAAWYVRVGAPVPRGLLLRLGVSTHPSIMERQERHVGPTEQED